MTGGVFREMHLYVQDKAYGITASVHPGEGDLDFSLSRLVTGFRGLA
jgi:hypothetical protein